MTAGAPLSATLHEPVVAQVVLWNLAPNAAEIDVGQSTESDYKLVVTRPDGARVIAGKPLWAQGDESLAWVKKTRLGPSQSYTRTLLLNEWYPFEDVGRYFVSVTVPGIEAPANIEVNVAPRDAGRLETLCERLSKNGPDPGWGGDLDPVRVLSFVTDDVAIPYLVRIASAPALFSQMGLEGLVRIGDLSALNALASFPQGRVGLIQILGSTRDDAVKKAVNSVLAADHRQ